MSHRNDCMFQSLAAQVAPGTINDMLYLYLLQNGGLAGNLNDLWNQVWDAQGVSPGDFNDRAWEFLGNLGHLQPDLPGRWTSFWCSGGVIETAINLLLNSRMCDEGAPNQVPEDFSLLNANKHVALFRRQAGVASWIFQSNGNQGVGLEQTISGLAAGDYVASVRIIDREIPVIDYAFAAISGANVTISQDFPTLANALAIGWYSCYFNNSGVGDVKFSLGVTSVDPNRETLMIEQPQIISGTTFKVADWTGTACTGPDVQVLRDSNGDLGVDVNGDYGYVPI